MMTGILWIAGVYGSCIVLLHIVHALYRRKSSGRSAYVVCITHNNELQIEWYIRSILFVSWLRGKPLKLVVFDDESEDDTVRIVEKAAASGEQVTLYRSVDGLDAFLEDHQRDDVTVIQLAGIDRHQNIPLLQ